MQSLTIVMFVVLAFTATIVTAWPVIPELQSNEQFVPESIDDLQDSKTDTVILVNIVYKPQMLSNFSMALRGGVYNFGKFV